MNIARGGNTDNAVMILRIRDVDGSIKRIAVPSGQETTWTIGNVLQQAGIVIDDKEEEGEEIGEIELRRRGAKIQIGTTTSASDDDPITLEKTLSDLPLKHGSLVNIIPLPQTKEALSATTTKEDESSLLQNQKQRYNPFPELAKSASHTTVSKRMRAISRSSKRGMSYGDIVSLRSSMHTVEPQSEGPVTRIYVCTVGAERFRNGCLPPTPKKKKAKKEDQEQKEQHIQNRVALLFGTINTERTEVEKRRYTRTSLSTPLEEKDYCRAAKVHAIWEPPQTPPISTNVHRYDASSILHTLEEEDQEENEEEEQNGEKKIKKKNKVNPKVKRAIELADALGLVPIGWIFTYTDNRSTEGKYAQEVGAGEGSLPVHGRDVVLAANIQMDNMKRLGADNGKKFITLAMNGNTGETEAFQLSDVSVQMVAEKVLHVDLGASKKKNKKKQQESGDKGQGKATTKSKGTNDDEGGRFVKTSQPILVDSKETTHLDTVLCLVNTAMLGHVGTFSGGGTNAKNTPAPDAATSPVKKNGMLTMKTKKRLLQMISSSSTSATTSSAAGDSDILEGLCDFHTLLALDSMLGKDDMDEICRLVKKWSRGQRRGTVMGDKLKMVLQSVLGG